MPDIPIILTAAGAVPRPIEDLRQSVMDGVAEVNPELAMSLPGSPQNAFCDTSVAALSDCDRTYVDLINSITPYAANETILNQWGYLFGIQRGLPKRPSVWIKFTGTPGFVIPKDFIVSDGTHQYQAAIGSVVNNDGFCMVYCIANTDGNWAINKNTVTQIVSSVYTSTVLVCTNPVDGVSSDSEESLISYRSRCITALQRTSVGTLSYAKDLLYSVVSNKRFVSVVPLSFAVKVIAGGGDPYEIANAIGKSGLDISRLAGSVIDEDRNITVSINDFRNSYKVLFVNPPAQKIEIYIYWNANNNNFASDYAVASLTKTAISNYINELGVGYKISIINLQCIFKEYVKPVIASNLLSKVDVLIKIDGKVQLPDLGGELVSGDFESYPITDESKVFVFKG